MPGSRHFSSAVSRNLPWEAVALRLVMPPRALTVLGQHRTAGEEGASYTVPATWNLIPKSPRAVQSGGPLRLLVVSCPGVVCGFTLKGELAELNGREGQGRPLGTCYILKRELETLCMWA